MNQASPMALGHELQPIAEGAFGEGEESSPAQRASEGVGDRGDRGGFGFFRNRSQKERKCRKTAQGIEVGKTERAANGKREESNVAPGDLVGERKGGQFLSKDGFKTGTAAKLDGKGFAGGEKVVHPDGGGVELSGEVRFGPLLREPG